MELPKIKLKSVEKIWLTSLWEKTKQNERISYRSMRAELHNNLPDNFRISNIDQRLARWDGTEITILGVLLIDPDFQLIKKADKIINRIKDYLIENPKLEQIEVKDIFPKKSFKQNEIGIILRLIGQTGFPINGSGNQDKELGYLSISLPRKDEEFDQVLNFKNVSKLITNHYSEKNENNTGQFYTRFESPILNIREPIFKSKIEHIDRKLCFVLMPFTETWSKRVHEKYIRKNIEAFGIQCLRADNLIGQIVIEDIWTKINQAAFIIADVTGKNPNVMYELGIAHTIGVPVILITQELEEIPFDFKHLRHYQYEDNSDGEEYFKERLNEIIPSIYQEHYPDIKLSFGN